jgi:hypothetical protein
MSLTPKPTLIKGVLFLKTGQKLAILESPDRTFTASSLTSSTIQRFMGTNQHLYFVQGDNIAYIEMEQSA